MNTGDIVYTGNGALNADGIAHISVDEPAGKTVVGFEDLFNGGDFDYNDNTFSCTNTKIAVAPLPAAGLMLESCLGCDEAPQSPQNRLNPAFKYKQISRGQSRPLL